MRSGVLGVALLLGFACFMARAEPVSARPGAPEGQPCLASAGYTWSPGLARCIRLFEEGLAFRPDPRPLVGAEFQAFLVPLSRSGARILSAEVYLPGQSAPVRVEPPSAGALASGATPVLMNRHAGVELHQDPRESWLFTRHRVFRRARKAADTAPT